MYNAVYAGQISLRTNISKLNLIVFGLSLFSQVIEMAVLSILALHECFGSNS